MTRKFLHEMLDEARSKDQQIKGQQIRLDQKIKAEYDELTKGVPSPAQKKRKEMEKRKRVSEGWSSKYKKSIDCNNPKGFSQRAHCQGRKKKKLQTYSIHLINKRKESRQ